MWKKVKEDSKTVPEDKSPPVAKSSTFPGVVTCLTDDSVEYLMLLRHQRDPRTPEEVEANEIKEAIAKWRKKRGAEAALMLLQKPEVLPKSNVQTGTAALEISEDPPLVDLGEDTQKIQQQSWDEAAVQQLEISAQTETEVTALEMREDAPLIDLEDTKEVQQETPVEVAGLEMTTLKLTEDEAQKNPDGSTKEFQLETPVEMDNVKQPDEPVQIMPENEKEVKREDQSTVCVGAELNPTKDSHTPSIVDELAVSKTDEKDSEAEEVKSVDFWWKEPVVEIDLD